MAVAQTSQHDETLRVDGVSVQFGGIVAVDEVNLNVHRGQRWAVIGPNGAGKTTLFRVISGETPPTSGRVHMFSKDVTRLPPNRRTRLGMGRTYQVTNVFLPLTVRENVAIAAQAVRRRRLSAWRPIQLEGALGEDVEKTLAQVDLSAQADSLAGELSHGEQRQLELAMALASSPKLLLLDEPAAGLSSAERVLMRRLITSLPAELSLVLIEHDMGLALDLVDRVLCLDNGRMIAAGTPEEIRANEQVQAVYLKSD